MQVSYFLVMRQVNQRSTCPVSTSLDVLGDKWTLLILRDILFAGKSSYSEFRRSEEKVATNILADRLALLESQGIVTKAVAAGKKSRFTYQLTPKGLDLAPLLLEFLRWGAKYGPPVTDPTLRDALHNDPARAVQLYQATARSENLP